LLLVLAVLVVPLSGCIEADVTDGVLLCSLDPNRLCPRGYYCASNNFCYRNGDLPSMYVPRDGSAVVPVDMALPVFDFAFPVFDQAQPGD
jgi:hypothetical protein